MCGIAGFVGRAGLAAQESSEIVKGMLKRIAHRGPDGSGVWSGSCAPSDEWRATLGHHRLSIIDLAGGAQPMANEDSTLWITFNGEIYNFADLRPKLERSGHRFATRSDTEVILHQYEERGRASFRDLDGMFAFALWDANEGELLLIRDRAGIKPLYYAELPSGGIAFASELGAMLAHPEIGRELDPLAVREYFFSDAVPPPRALVKGIRKVPAGHFVAWKNGVLAPPARYWGLGEIRPFHVGSRSVEDLAGELRTRLGDAVGRQLVSDVPVGVFLSGGIDSSLVAALAAARTSGRLKTFSVGFEDPSFDERSHARIVSESLGTDHSEEILSEERMLTVLDRALDSLDEPIGDPSILPTWLLSRLAAKSVKVVLTGDAGDELWGGYPTYRAHRYASAYTRLPSILKKHLIPHWVSRLPTNDRYQPLEWKLKRFACRWDDDRERRHARWMSGIDLPGMDLAFGEGDDPELPAAAFSDPYNQLLAQDFLSYLPNCVLSKVDRASMAHGLEARPPMLDAGLVDWSFSLPSNLKLRGLTGKFLLKQAARTLLPAEIIRRKKRGFGIPLARWIRDPLRRRVEEAVHDSPFWRHGVGNQRVFLGWMNEHFERRADHSKPLWSLLVLDHWMRKAAVNR